MRNKYKTYRKRSSKPLSLKKGARRLERGYQRLSQSDITDALIALTNWHEGVMAELRGQR